MKFVRFLTVKLLSLLFSVVPTKQKKVKRKPTELFQCPYKKKKLSTLLGGFNLEEEPQNISNNPLSNQ